MISLSHIILIVYPLFGNRTHSIIIDKNKIRLYPLDKPIQIINTDIYQLYLVIVNSCKNL